MKFNIYTAWLDPVFYAAGAIFAVSLFSLLYSIRRYVELNNSDEFDETPAEDAASAVWPGPKTSDATPPAEQPGAEFEATVRVEPEAAGTPESQPLTAPGASGTPESQPGAEFEATVRVEPEAQGQQPSQPDSPPRAPADSGSGRAETFVRGIYEELSGLDVRLKNIEDSVSKSRVNNDFTVKFLEDILSDLDALDKEKIKARIEYLLSDLKK